MDIKGLLFDLDGVIVDTAKYHYLAWKQIAEELQIPFSEKENERLKGVSRKESLQIILDLGSVVLTEAEKEAICARKNARYLDYIGQLTQEDILPGVREFLEQARKDGCRIALGSASKNAVLILEKLGLKECFDAVVDGTRVRHAKPDPEVFLTAAEDLGLAPEECMVFEDSEAGIEAAHRGGMIAVAVGNRQTLPQGDCWINGFRGITLTEIFREQLKESIK